MKVRLVQADACPVCVAEAEGGMQGAWLEDLTWDEARDCFAAGMPVLIPVGAAAKEHGLHLPLATDRILAEALARRVAAELPILVAPVIGFGHYPAFTAYAGSQSLSADTFMALVFELMENLIAQGVRRIAVLNTGVSTEAPLQLAARRIFERFGVRPAIADLRNLGRGVSHLLAEPGGGHADERETSLMLAIAPERVQLSRARAEAAHPSGAQIFRLPVRLSPVPAAECEVSASGATGDPTRASAGKGQAILDAMTAELVEGLRALYPDVLARRDKT